MEDEVPTCRICLGGTEDGELIQPCSCRGSMRWVHSRCLSTWWQGREETARGIASMSGMQCDICGDALAIASLGGRWSWFAQCLHCFVVECCWMQFGPPAWRRRFSGSADTLRDRFQETWENLVTYKYLLLFGFFYDWWFLGLWSIKRPLSSHDMRHRPPPQVRHVMQAGLWLLPAVLWCSVAIWAANPSLHRMSDRSRLRSLLRFMVLDEIQLQHLSMTIIAVVATCGSVSLLFFTTQPHAIDSNQGMQKAQPFPWGTCVPVFLPALALVLLKLCFCMPDGHSFVKWLWPAYSSLLEFETHIFYVIAVMAMNVANAIGLAVNSFSRWTADLLLKEVLCKDAPLVCSMRRHQLHEDHGVKPLFSLLQMACAVIIFQHCLLMLRSGSAAMAVREPEEGNNYLRTWSRFGVCALGMPGVSLVSLFFGSSLSVCYAVCIWSCFVLCLCRMLRVSVLQECYVLSQALTAAVVNRVQMTVSLYFWRDSLRSGSVTFTNRQQPDTGTAEPLLGATPVHQNRQRCCVCW